MTKLAKCFPSGRSNSQKAAVFHAGRQKIADALLAPASILKALLAMMPHVIHGKDLVKMRKLMQKAINTVQKWARESGLSMSPHKTHAILFTTKVKVPDIDTTLKIGNQVIEYVDSTKCLGVTFDKKLTWNEHINNKMKQAKMYLHQIKTSIGCTWGTNPEKMLWIWTSVIRPAISYASYIWGTKLTKTQRSKLNKIQRDALMQLRNFRFTTP